MRVSVCLGAILIPGYLDFYSGYSAPRSRIPGIYSGIYSYSGISQTNAPLVTSVLLSIVNHSCIEYVAVNSCRSHWPISSVNYADKRLKNTAISVSDGQNLRQNNFKHFTVPHFLKRKDT